MLLLPNQALASSQRTVASSKIWTKLIFFSVPFHWQTCDKFLLTERESTVIIIQLTIIRTARQRALLIGYRMT
jgi:hypothetical protein